MSSKKITDADKLEIVDLYRLAGDTTASLASRFGVSNSTISRLLKTNIPGAEYELLIQQKRGSKVEIDEESTTDEPIVMSTAIPAAVEDRPSQPDSVIPSHEDPAPLASTLAPDGDLVPLPASNTEQDSNTNRRVRRRSSAPLAAASDEPTESNQSVTTREPIPVAVEFVEPIPVVVEMAEVAFSDAPIASNTDIYTTDPSPKITVQPPIPRTPALREILSDSKDRYSNPPPPAPEPIAEIFTDEFEDLDSNSEDVNALAAMFGEEIADGDDDDEFGEEDWDEEPTSADEQVDRNQFLTEDRLNVQVTPLSKATLPRTCYIVIDKFAELIVRPLKDFADLGQISGEEIQQRTLPVFDNHRVAKRFSNQRTQRVIKVPDSRVFYKTTQQLRSKGITCLLVDGNIYSLN